MDVEKDNVVLGYSTGEGRNASGPFLDGLRHVAGAAAARLRQTQTVMPVVAACFSDEAAARGCAKKFIQEFGTRALRRPIEAWDENSLLMVYDAGRKLGKAGDVTDRFHAGLELTVKAILQSPSFLYRVELGDPRATPGSTTRLTAHELAAAVSYMVLASPPDAELVASAQMGGRLGTAAGMRAEVERLIRAQPERFKAQMRRFVAEWLGIDFQNRDAWPKEHMRYSEAVKEGLQQGLGLFVDAWASSGPVLQGLLTTKDAYINEATAPIYDATGVSGSATQMQKVTLNPAQRSGILTHPAFLASHSHHDESSLILRAIPIRNRVLCSLALTVPANVPLPPAVASIKPTERTTTRKRYNDFIESKGPSCTGCHNLINPIGNAFEGYDQLGIYRTEENKMPIDTTGAIVGTERSDRNVASAIEMAEALAESPDVHECFTRQVVRYAMGRLEYEHERCALVGALKSGASPDIRDVLYTLLTDPNFALRQTAPK
jgi:hypothetical protein